jgi:hypothetical protein
MVTRNLRRRLAGGEAAVDLGALEVLACLTISHAGINLTPALMMR